MENPIISVIMLTFNRENLVTRMIECVLAQTFRHFEFIIVDNGSTDRSGSIADEYALKDQRIRVIHKKRGNIGSGRNAGLNDSNGKWIAFVDDDDYCEPDFLDFMYRNAIDCNADVSICGALGKPENERRIMSAEQALETMYWRVEFNNQFPTKLIKRSCFDKIRFSEDAIYDDIELMTQVIAAALKVVYDGKVKYVFYRHDSNNSAWTANYHLLTKETLEEYLEVYRARTIWLCERFSERTDTWRYFEWSFWISMIDKIKKLALSDCFPQCERLIAELKPYRQEFLTNANIRPFEREWVEQYV